MKLVRLIAEENQITGGVTYQTLVFVDGELKTIIVDNGHPGFQRTETAIERYKDGMLSEADFVQELYQAGNLEAVVENRLERAFSRIEGSDGRLTLENGNILFDHDPIDPVLESHVLRMIKADGSPKSSRDWVAFVKFIENLYSNQTKYVRDQFFGWMNYENTYGQGFTLTTDGCVLGYKGCAGTVEEPLSVHSGTAIADGVTYHGQIPNLPGTVIEMPRSSVQDDPSVGCSTGLHIGTYNYAKDWARGVLLTVKFNPRDVVSVPTECDAQKIRVSRYEVVEAVEGPLNSLSWGDDEDEVCENCGEFYYDCDCGYYEHNEDDSSYCDYCSDDCCYDEEEEDSYDRFGALEDEEAEDEEAEEEVTGEEEGEPYVIQDPLSFLQFLALIGENIVTKIDDEDDSI